MKKKFKMPSAFTTIFIIIFVIAILTWIVPAGTYQYVDPNADKLVPIPGTYTVTEQNPQGLFEIIASPISGFFDAVDIILFVLVIGGFLGVVMKTGAINAGIGHTVKKLTGREQIMIPILMLLFGLGGTVFGMCEETIAFYLLIIPIFIAAGYDAMTGAVTIFLGAGIGCVASTVNPFCIGIASGFAGLSVGDGLLLRVILFVVLQAVGIAYVMRYAKKVKEDPSKSLIYHMKEENESFFLSNKDGEEMPELTTRRKLILVVFGLCFVIMVLGVIPWSAKFNINIFDQLNEFLVGIPAIGPLLGHLVPLGSWWFSEMAMLFLIGSVIIAIIARFGEEETVDTFIDGARDLLGVALIIGVARGITIVMADGGMTATILHLGEENLKNVSSLVFADLTYLFYLPMSFLMPSTSGLATLSMPILAPLADFAGVGRDVVVTAFATASGVMNLITPTSGVLMGALALARIPYGTFFKFMMKLVVVFSVIIMVALSVSVMLNPAG